MKRYPRQVERLSAKSEVHHSLKMLQKPSFKGPPRAFPTDPAFWKVGNCLCPQSTHNFRNADVSSTHLLYLVTLRAMAQINSHWCYDIASSMWLPFHFLFSIYTENRFIKSIQRSCREIKGKNSADSKKTSNQEWENHQDVLCVFLFFFSGKETFSGFTLCFLPSFLIHLEGYVHPTDKPSHLCNWLWQWLWFFSPLTPQALYPSHEPCDWSSTKGQSTFIYFTMLGSTTGLLGQQRQK